jgi:transposase
VSILTLCGRVIVPYSGYTRHLALIRSGASLGAARLWYDQPHKRFSLLVSLEIELPGPPVEQYTSLVGVDVGIRYLAVTSTSTGDPAFFAGKQTKHRANHYARLRKRSQQKGAQWSLAELHALIASKAVLAGSLVIKVEADYTSKACPTCGFTHDDNRPNRGLVFHCGNCHYELHADLVGARTIVISNTCLLPG